MRKISNEKIDDQLKENGRTIVRVGDIINIHTPIDWKCNNCLYVWVATPVKVLNSGTGCPCCAGLIKQTNKTIDQRLTDGNRTIVRVDDIINIHTPIKWKCTVCAHVWEATPSNVLNKGTGCNRCGHAGVFNKSYFSNHPHKKTSPGLLYLVELEINNAKFLKIGISERTVGQRYASQKIKLKIKELASTPMMLFDAYSIEQEILHKYIKFLGYPEGKFNGRTECIQYDPIILADILCNYFNRRLNDQPVV